MLINPKQIFLYKNSFFNKFLDQTRENLEYD